MPMRWVENCFTVVRSLCDEVDRLAAALRPLPSTPESDAMTACGLAGRQAWGCSRRRTSHSPGPETLLCWRVRDVRRRLRICRQIIQQSPKRDRDRANNRYPCFCPLRVQSSSECQKYQARIYNEQCASTLRRLECIFLARLK